MIEKLLLKLRARDEVGPAEQAALLEMVETVKDVPADTVLVHEGDELSNSTLLISGMMSRYKDLRDAGRQISAIHIPGDFVDLHSFTLKVLDHNILTMTDCRIGLVPHDRLTRITENFPHLTRLLWFTTTLDAAMHREWELSLGRRSAIARTAHLFCELMTRLTVIGMADADGYDLPVSQVELAECLGLTSVHVNRTLKELRQQGIVEFRNRRVIVLNRAEMERVAEFRPNYLYLSKRQS